jgi:Xaa-Pro aminopeptidase
VKITEFAKNMPESVDAVMILSEENRLYFTGFPSSDGCLLIARDRAVFFTDSRYIEAAAKSIAGCEIRESGDFTMQFTQLLAEWGVSRVGIEAERLTVSRFVQYQSRFSPVDFVADGEVDRLISAMRSVKSEEELACIETAQKIAEDAFAHILGFIAVGKTEREIALELDFYMLRRGAEAVSFETIAVSGANSSMPHGVPSQKKLAKGDLLTMDFGAVYKGYHSDMTRTVAIGCVDGGQREVYDIVLAAQKACLAGLREGLSCVDADALAREQIQNSGYGDNFSHGTGHGVGIEIHESPNLSPRSVATLARGNVVTVEPGIYLPGRFGVRIEDMAFITEGGCRNLTAAPKELLVL